MIEPSKWIKTHPLTTDQFCETNIKILLTAIGISVLSIVLLFLLKTKVCSGKALIAIGKNDQSPVFELKRSVFLPAYQIQIRAAIPDNHWLDYEVVLAKGKEEVLGYEQEAWRESGIWQEEGQSGTWSESDTQDAFTFIPHSSGNFHLIFSLSSFQGVNGAATQSKETLTLHYTVFKNAAPFSTLFTGLFILVSGLCWVTLLTLSSQDVFDEKTFYRMTEPNEFEVEMRYPDRLICLCLEINRKTNGPLDRFDVFYLSVTAPDGKQIVIKGFTKPVKKHYGEDGKVLLKAFSRHLFYYIPALSGRYSIFFQIDGKAQHYTSCRIKCFYQEKTIRPVLAYHGTKA